MYCAQGRIQDLLVFKTTFWTRFYKIGGGKLNPTKIILLKYSLWV